MERNELYEQCCEAINELSKDAPFYFLEAIEVPTNIPSAPYMLWGACVSDDGKLYVCDGSGRWDMVSKHNDSDIRVIQSLHAALFAQEVQLKTEV